MNLYVIGMFWIIGVVFGSFYNVVGLRVPLAVSFINSRSNCPYCNRQLCWFELIPLFSYMFQKGKCSGCRHKISVLYPLIEMLTASLFAYAYIKIGLRPELLVALLLISLLIIILVTDLLYMIIPNNILLFFLPLFLLLRMIVPLDNWYNSILGALVGFSIIAIIIVLSNGGMGAGDMKLLALLGIVLGMGKILLTFFIAVFLGSVIGFGLMLFKDSSRKQAIPFGPYIVVAALLSYFYGDIFIHLYQSFFAIK